MTPKLKAPFPYFGGKSAVAAEIWKRFGRVSNYVEPFFGSGAVLLGRPDWRPGGPRLIETVNDADGLLANFWRAMTTDADAVAHYADWPVNEADLHARHLWLVGQRERITERLMGDPDWFDAKAAGWWVWGICAWIGGGWCSGKGPWSAVDGVLTRTGQGIIRKLPHLGGGGRGINRKLPHLGDAGQGINRKLPHLGDAGRGSVYAHLAPLAQRLREVRVACGDWSRVLGAALWPFGGMAQAGGRKVAVFLDPPYGEGFDGAYAATSGRGEDASISARVWEWAAANGGNPALRICVAGYEDGRTVPDGWSTARWSARGGYGNQANGAGRANAKRETLWFSPHCLRPDEGQMSMGFGT